MVVIRHPSLRISSSMFSVRLPFAVCLIFLTTFFAVSGNTYASDIAPDREISIIQEEPSVVPEWKRIWDIARAKVRINDYQAAVSQYQQLYALKPTIEEATWEYCKVLLKLQNFQAAAHLIRWLLEQNSSRVDYFIAAGQVAEFQKDYKRAVKYFGRAYEIDPIGANSDSALRGLVGSLREQKRNRLAYPLLELLSLRFPDDMTILRQFAQDARSLGKRKTAQKLYLLLIEKEGRIDDTMLFQAAELFDEPGLEEQCNAFRLEYIKRYPDYLPFRIGLANYYSSRKQFDKAVEQLEFVIEKTSSNQEYIRQAAGLYENKLRRPDKALLLYDRYLDKHPGQDDIVKRIDTIQTNMAREFMVLIENDGATLLWEDLDKIAPNRLAIFLEMADQFAAREKTKELIEVLSIVYRNSPFDAKIAVQLVRAYGKEGEITKARELVENIATGNRTKDMYLELAQAARSSGEDRVVLSAYEGLLAVEPQDWNVRTEAITLAGTLGLTEKIDRFWDDSKWIEPGRASLVLAYLRGLVHTYRFRRFDEIIDIFKTKYIDNPKVLLQLDLVYHEKMYRQGLSFESEQLLRSLLNRGFAGDEIAFNLAEQALAEHDSDKATIWLSLIPNLPMEKGLDDSNTALRLRRILLEGERDKLEKRYTRIQKRVGDTYAVIEGRQSQSDEVQKLTGNLLVQRCETFFLLGRLKDAQICVDDIGKNYPDNLHRLVLQEHLAADRPSGVQSGGRIYENLQSIIGQLSIQDKLELVDLLIDSRSFTLADLVLKDVRKKIPESIVAHDMLLEISLHKGNIPQALRTAEDLQSILPREPYFSRRTIAVELAGGAYQRALQRFHSLLKVENSKQAVDLLGDREDYAGLLDYARILWGCKKQVEALWAYRRIMTPPVLVRLDEDFSAARINYLYINREHSFWSSLLVMLQSEPNLLANLMSPQFIAENRGEKSGAIVANHYAAYRWQSRINYEYSARKASYERNYYYAEQTYKELLDSNENAETMIDLANVYGRIGKYRQEAKVYEQMQKQGISSQDLQSSIERTNLQTKPRTSLDFNYRRSEGREGFVDIVSNSFGTSFWMTPDLDKDFQIGYDYTRFESTDGSLSTEGNRFLGSGNFDIDQSGELFFSSNIQKLKDSDSSRFGYELGYRRKLDQNIVGFLSYGKEYVEDSVTAIQNNVSFQQFTTGLSLETPFGMGVGGDFGHRNYNDNHDQNRLHAFVTHTFFGQDTEWNTRYDYRYQRNDEDNEGLDPNDAATDNASSYWRPKKMSDHQLSVEFKHNFLGFKDNASSIMSYYTVRNIVGLEEENTTYSALFDIFLEISPHFLLKGNFVITTSSDYEESLLSASLNYRW